MVAVRNIERNVGGSQLRTFICGNGRNNRNGLNRGILHGSDEGGMLVLRGTRIDTLRPAGKKQNGGNQAECGG